MPSFILLSLFASLAYGASDFFGGLAARRLNLIHATAGTYLVATIVIGVWLAIDPGVWTVDDAAVGALAGVLAVVGFVAFYAALAIGPMSLLSPAIALIGAVLPVAAAGILGEKLAPLAWGAIALAVIATVLISIPSRASKERVTPRAAVLALVAGLGLGGSIVAINASDEASGLVPAFVEMLVGLGILGLVIIVLRLNRHRFGLVAIFEPPPASTRQRLTARRAWGSSAIAGLLLGAANALILLALHAGSLAIVSVLVSLYPLATVVLAALVLRERITVVQALGIVLAIAACVILAIA